MRDNDYLYEKENVLDDIGVATSTSNDFLRTAFLHMALGLLVTTFMALYLVFFNVNLLLTFARYFMVVAIGHLAIVLVLNLAITKISSITAKLLFYLYSAITGITIATVGLIYSTYSIIITLAITLSIFVAMAAYGYITKEDLSGYRKYFMVGLFALIITSLINIYFKAPMLYWFSTIAGVAIFTLLIAYDVNRIKRWSYELRFKNPDIVEKMGIIAALSLYLDFINLFLYLLRIFGRRK
ncbi:MAG: Bax inhibitor-1/YccA family protein [Fusobacteriaceae bacterium]|nr:Bax inhibitor-1/YccA family protein [Fusobacteriaceae bacterium]